MQKAMVFIDFENFDIAKYHYYKDKCLIDSQNEALAKKMPLPAISPINNPKLDFNTLPQKLVDKLTRPHILIKTFLFAPKPDDFLMKDAQRLGTYNWINGMKNQDYFTVVEGVHSARPVAGYTYSTMSLSKPSSYYIEEKRTDINIASHLITKGFMNSYDTAILMSGDTDYIPVMDILNTFGKTIIVVGVKGQKLDRFKHHSDAQIILDDEFFQSCLRNNK